MKKGLITALSVVGVAAATVAVLNLCKCKCKDGECNCCKDNCCDLKDDETTTFHHPV